MNINLNPQHINLNGSDLVLLTKEEYEQIQEELEDLEDLRLLREAKANEDPTKRKSLEEVMKSQGIEI
jgi:PHD/YefM family antitoxin component YafN of YafNO toxin-antitoxin module